MKLGNSFEYIIKPCPPYDFGLTMQKPAGWSLFTSFEVFEKDAVWTATHLDGILSGIKLINKGTVEKPKIIAKIFVSKKPDEKQKERMKRSLNYSINADGELEEFYKTSRKDPILKHTIKDLYGMHSTSSETIYPDAILAILLQMAPLKRSNEMMDCVMRNYGDLAEFDGKKIYAWPLPEKLSKVSVSELKKCKLGYRAKNLVNLSKMLVKGFPSSEELEGMDLQKARDLLLELPGIGDYSADIINPHGGFPIDVWSAEVFSKLFHGKKPANNRDAVERIKKEGLRRWGENAWMAFFYTVQDLKNLSKKLGIELRLE